ncbi:MAG: hypothetical protein IMW97_01205 [Firmicutes bacterium]|nr:hypothetical protein [Candidatus Fermentithermobacillaceae bacterium]
MGPLVLGVIGSLLITWRLAELASERARASLVVRSESGEKEATPRKGLIAILSVGAEASAEVAIKYHEKTLKHCWLLVGTSSQPQGPSQVFDAIRNKYQDTGIEFHKVDIRNPYDPAEVFRKVRDIYEEARTKYGLREHEIIADYTGGTKSMSIGLALAASLSANRDLEYVIPRRQTAEETAVREIAGTIVKVDLGYGARASGKQKHMFAVTDDEIGCGESETWTF